MAGPLGKYGEEKEARRKAAIKSMGGLVGDVVGFIPGAGAVGAGIKKATGLLAGDDAMAATPMPQDKKKERESKVDQAIGRMKSQTARTKEDIQKDRMDLLEDKEDLSRMRNRRAAQRLEEAMQIKREEEARRKELD